MVRSVQQYASSGGSRRLRGVMLALLLVSATANATEPEQWLERMHRALVELDYAGEFSYFHGQELTSLRIAHAVVDGVRKERLVHLNGTPRELIRDGDEVTCFIPPGDHLLNLDQTDRSSPFARAFSRPPQGLPEVYRATMGPSGRVAGREAVQVRIQPEQQDRYGYRLWLDEETGLLLRSELIDMRGKPREVFQFVRVEIGGPIEASLLQAPEHSGLVRHKVRYAEPTAEVSPQQIEWEAGWLPAGFRMSGWDLRHQSGQDRPAIASLMYSDGLASFSIFLESADGAGIDQQMRRGATVAVMREVRHETISVPWRVMVVGEVPMQMAERIADHVRPVRH